MRLLHVAPFYEPALGFGGMARAASCLCRALAGQGHRVTVATARLDPGHPPEEWLGGVRVRRFDGPAALRRRLVPWSGALAGFLELELARTDVAHLHGHRSGLALRAARSLTAAGVPYVLQPHGTFPHHGRYRALKAAYDRLWGDRMFHGAAAVLAVSRSEQTDLPRPAVLLPNGVAAPSLPARPRRRPGARLLHVGSDHPQKRGLLLRALLEALPEASLDAAGRYGRPFTAAFARFGPRVRFLGALDEGALASACCEADLLVQPAAGEAFGLAPFEAALLGTPSVVAGGHGSGEWFSLAGGCVVPPDDIGALLEATQARLADPALGRGEASAVAAFARRELAWDAVAARLARLYEALCAPSPATTAAVDALGRGE